MPPNSNEVPYYEYVGKFIGVLISSILGLVGIIFGFAKVAYNDNKKKIEKLIETVEELEQRIIKLETRNEVNQEHRNNHNN